MAEKADNTNLPMTVVTRIVREALPDGINLSKEARTGLSKAASVFVVYVTAAASNVMKRKGKKLLTGQDVIEAMEDIEFDGFVAPLSEALEAYKKKMAIKKPAGKKKKLEPIEED